jgi:hypothetical protein
MGRWLDRAGKAAAMSHGATEAYGRIAGDLHPSTNIHNDFSGEVNFSLLMSNVAGMLEPYLGERPEPTKAYIQLNAYRLKLWQQDYVNIALQSGSLYEKHGMLCENTRRADVHRQWIEQEYARQAHLVYEAGRTPIDFTAYYTNREPQAHAWRGRAEKFASFVAHDTGFAPICTMPHVGQLLHHAAQFTDQRMLEDSSVLKTANDIYGMRMQQIEQRSKSGMSVQVADSIGRASIEYSNTLVQSDPTIRGSSVPFELLEYAPENTARAISQVFMVNVLKAVESRDIETTALMSDIAYCGWAMTRLDHQDYSDAAMGHHLGNQWQIGLETDPAKLYADNAYRAECYEILEKQLVGLRSPNY